MNKPIELNTFQYAVLHRSSPDEGWEILAVCGREKEALKIKLDTLESEWVMEEKDTEVRIVRWQPVD